MKLTDEIKPIHLLIGIVVCIVIGMGAARVIAPQLARKQVNDETITIGDTKNDTSQKGVEVNRPPEDTTAPTPNEGLACIQVITSARNPQTDEIKDFPTPCDIPKGWEIIPTTTTLP